jgi:hypothetical protein
MATNAKWLSDVQATAIDGVHSGREPELIGEQQLAYARNISARGGRAHSRPRLVNRLALPNGKLQGVRLFRANERLIASLGGRVYEINPDDWSYVEKTSNDDRNSALRPRHYYCETVGSLVIQDGSAKAIIYDGANFRRSADGEVPTGTAMAYGNGRLAVVVNERKVRIGDIRKVDHQSELKFTETYNLTGGGDFNFASPIKALAVMPVIDTSTGHGPLIVGSREKIHTLRTQLTERSLWSEVGFETVLLPERGITGPNAVVAVNQDLYFRSIDGLRSIRSATSDADSPGLAPISAEVSNRLDFDTQGLLEDAVVFCFDNRVFCTHSPFVYDRRSLAQGLISLDLAPLSSVRGKTPPVYDGEWDGVVIADATVGQVRGTDRCFLLGRDEEGVNGIWELLAESTVVAADEDPTHAIETRVLFGDSPAGLKHLRRADLWFSGIRGPVEARVYFRADKHPFWVKWDTFNFTVGTRPAGFVTPQTQRRLRQSTKDPRVDVDLDTGLPVSTGYGFQIRVEWEGDAKLEYLVAYSESILETPKAQRIANPAAQAATVPSWGYLPSFWRRHTISPRAGI